MAKQESGGSIVWPRGDDGRRSSLRAGAAIIAAALEPLDGAAAAAARTSADWRQDYLAAIRRLVAAGTADGEAALHSAAAGLATAQRTLFIPDRGAELTLAAAGATYRQAELPLETLTIAGRGDAGVQPWTVPYRGRELSGAALLRQIEDWAQRGIIEADTAEALQQCAANADWFDLSDRTLVLLGAGSEVGPLRRLLGWRANLALISRPSPDAWQRIAALVAAGNAQVQIPLQRAAPRDGDWPQVAGADLLATPWHTANWLAALQKPLDVAALGYADGERHVRLTLGMDWIMQELCRRDRRTSLAFLASPSDVFAVPPAATGRAAERFARRSPLTRMAQMLSGGRWFLANVAPDDASAALPIIDGLVAQQGPNYALAKRLQAWRALVARAAGQRVSFNVAPPSASASVLSNGMFGAAYRGARHFGLEVFAPETTSAVMAALWVHDLRNPRSTADPAVRLEHPYRLLSSTAVHGGIWTSAYQLRSALPAAALIGLMTPG
jgi:hypothetical protein